MGTPKSTGHTLLDKRTCSPSLLGAWEDILVFTKIIVGSMNQGSHLVNHWITIRLGTLAELKIMAPTMLLLQGERSN